MTRKLLTILLTALLATGMSQPARGADFALKTNLLYDAALSPNLGIEMSVSPRWSVELSGNLNAWNLKNGQRLRHWLVQPEARHWFCEAMGGHFVGANLLGGQYNVGHLDLPFSFFGLNLRSLKNSRCQGWLAGVGVSYGYALMLGRHWNLEAELGIGWIHSRYDRYPCATCGTKIESGSRNNYFGPTKAAINLVYVF